MMMDSRGRRDWFPYDRVRVVNAVPWDGGRAKRRVASRAFVVATRSPLFVKSVFPNMFSIHRVSAGADDAEGTELELAEDAPHPMRPSRARAARGDDWTNLGPTRREEPTMKEKTLTGPSGGGRYRGRRHVATTNAS